MSIRHRLIRLLSFGDMILMNAEISPAGVLRTREAGGFLIENVRIDHQKSAAVGLNYSNAGLLLESTPKQALAFRDCFFRQVPA